ncbi:MAG: DUF1553 domain-containing protein [Planctomycetaceae bacterium]|nr:MAG: DUF1553 domain-containing protein [Planctomycetaceae bacterium]
MTMRRRSSCLPGPRSFRRAARWRLLPFFPAWLLACFLAWSLASPHVSASGEEPAAEAFDFSSDIQPLLAERCLLCHGPDVAEAGLRLDLSDRAHAVLDSGQAAIVAGDPDGSELIRRLITEDEHERMPPEGEPLTADQVAMLKAWVAAGGKYETHWAYRPIALPALPEPSTPEWCVGGIDRFVLARLDSAGIEPSPPKSPEALIRRLYADLIGLPPEIDEVDAFVADPSPDAYERLVDRLLGSEHFGERWARHWLDMARYADSDGYEKDNPRPNAWRYRDWVIDAINRDLPLDGFTIEQLAGDLLEDASPMQTLATAFHRQTLTNTEGGVDKEEFRVEATFDRTETTAAVWMALTLNCARCHTHKYDAISHRDYYQLFAIFNGAGETELEVPRNEAAWDTYVLERTRHDAKVAEAESDYLRRLDELRPQIEAWDREWSGLAATAAAPLREHPAVPLGIETAGESVAEIEADGSVRITGPVPDSDRYTIRIAPPRELSTDGSTDGSMGPLTGIRIEVMPDESLAKSGPGRAANGNFVLTHVELKVELAELKVELLLDDGTTDSGEAGESEAPYAPRPIPFASAEADFSQTKFPPENALQADPKTGWAISPQMGQTHSLSLFTAEPIEIPDGQQLVLVLDQQYGGKHTLGRFRIHTLTGHDPLRSLPSELAAAVRLPAARRSAVQTRLIADHVAASDPVAKGRSEKLARLRAQPPASPVMKAAVLRAEPRTTRRLDRGDFLQPAEEIAPGGLEVLHALHPLGSRDPDSPPDRLDLARWLVSPDHPLTPRVMVNQVWQRLMGRGIVPTLADFGVRGDPPTHPELLDWLAYRLPRDLGWSRKALIKEIVMSATYRQSSRHRPELVAIDPTNRLLARQNRVRVEAEIVRDLVLATSGLLDRTVGGPSVFPPLPPGVAELSYANNFKWALSDGGDRYRRGMYTFFKRTSPHPTLITFDCPDSNTSQLSREISNTPLQALTMLNNVVFAEASVALAARVLSETASEVAAEDVTEDTSQDATRLRHAFRLCLSRDPDAEELDRFADLLAAGLAHYREHPDQARRLIGVANVKPDAGEGAEPARLAAWASTLRILLNLDEFIVRE